MSDREATMKAYNALHFNLPVIEDYGTKEQLEVQHNAINELDHALAKPEREWVGLHLDDMPETYVGDRSFLHGARWAEAKLKEKNGD